MTLNKELVQQLEDIANRLRINSIRSTTAAKSGYVAYEWLFSAFCVCECVCVISKEGL